MGSHLGIFSVRSHYWIPQLQVPTAMADNFGCRNGICYGEFILLCLPFENPFDNLPRIVYDQPLMMLLMFFFIPGGVFCMWKYNDKIVMLPTSFVGAYMTLRAIGLFFGNYPNEFTLARYLRFDDGKEYLLPYYIYTAITLALFMIGYCLQKRVKKEIEKTFGSYDSYRYLSQNRLQLEHKMLDKLNVKVKSDTPRYFPRFQKTNVELFKMFNPSRSFKGIFCSIYIYIKTFNCTYKNACIELKNRQNKVQNKNTYMMHSQLLNLHVLYKRNSIFRQLRQCRNSVDSKIIKAKP
eukprot:TRINITY_DN827_c0_g1_i1.p1 TRINITY_DN827_c0_g1~~TRINITY_DN827_c0_g1_i1.p1  ORF type:complete len:294 (-),score=-21.61 TRINITY_DN827_c0_g1_i1:120-1001(-)